MSKPPSKVIDLKSRIPINFSGDDPVLKLAAKLTLVLAQNPGTAVQELAALGVVAKAVRNTLRADGMGEKEVDAIATEALHLSISYRVDVETKDPGDKKGG